MQKECAEPGLFYMVLRDNVRVFVACEEDLHPNDNEEKGKKKRIKVSGER